MNEEKLKQLKEILSELKNDQNECPAWHQINDNIETYGLIIAIQNYLNRYDY